MTFQQLRYLLEVYHTGSISKAAANLFVTRPSISFSVTSLETELGYPIFIRTQNGLIPSPQGELVLEYASRICETHKLITSIGLEKRKRIEIGSVSYEPINRAFMRVLDENKHRRDVSFSFKAHNGTAFKKLSLFEVDCVLTAPFTVNKSYVQAHLNNHSLQWKELTRIPVYICIGPGHRLYNEPDVSPRDFENDTLLDTSTRALSRCTFLKDIIKFNGDLAISSYYPTVNYQILEKGLAYKICKRPSDKTIKHYGLRCIPLEGVSQQLMYATNPMRPLAPEVSHFLELVEEEIKTFNDPFPAAKEIAPNSL